MAVTCRPTKSRTRSPRSHLAPPRTSAPRTARDRVQGDRHVRRFVVGPAEFLRREERAVGLDEQAIERRRARRLPQMLVLRVRHVAGEAQVVAARHALARDVGVAAEAVDHHPLRRTLVQYSKDVGPCVADVDDERLAGLPREGDVEPERPAPGPRPGRVHPEVVEAATPPRPRTRGSSSSSSSSAPSRVVEGRGVVGVQARRREDPARANRPARGSGGSFGRPRPRRSGGPRPAARAASTTSGGSRSRRNRWQWVSTAPVCTATSGFWSLIASRAYRSPPAVDQGCFT